MKIKPWYINLILENCESIIINIDNIEKLNISNISTTHLYGNNPKNGISSYEYCEEFEIVINKKKDKIYEIFNGIMSDVTLFQRLLKNDLISIAYLDAGMEELEEIFMPWCIDECYEYNTYQQTHIDHNGNLVIKVKKGINNEDRSK